MWNFIVLLGQILIVIILVGLAILAVVVVAEFVYSIIQAFKKGRF